MLGNQRVLVTGGLGFIGSHLIRRLLAEGCSVTVLDDESTGTRENLAGVAGVERVNVILGTVLDREAVANAAQGCDMVIHLASVVGMQLAMRSHAKTYRVAVEGTRHVLEETEDLPIVLMSSSCVYGHLAESCDEDRPVAYETALAFDGGSPGYATGKWQIERMGFQASAHGRRVLIVRPFNVVGPRQRSHYGMVLPRFIERASSGSPLVIYDDGRQERSFSDVRTFVDALLALIDCERAWQYGKNVVNLGTPNATSIRELAECVRTELGAEVPITCVPFTEVFPGLTDVRRRVPKLERLHEYVGARTWPSVQTIVRDLAGLAHA